MLGRSRMAELVAAAEARFQPRVPVPVGLAAR
jgi:hypothetical protein